MVEFFKTSIPCKAIKYLLSQTALPLYKTITADEYIIAGCKYIYKDKLILCTKSGNFEGLNSSLSYDDHLVLGDHITVNEDPEYISVRGKERDRTTNTDKWPTSHIKIPIDIDVPLINDSNWKTLQPSDPAGIGQLKKKLQDGWYKDYLTVTDDVIRQYLRPFAEIEIIEDYEFGIFKPGISYYHISNSNYYDTDTHYYLGEYLRCLRDIKGLDLMSLYNCFTYHYVDNVYIDIKLPKPYLSDTLPKNKKVTLIPIKFNKTYTIATNCDFKILAKSILYKDEIIKDANGDKYISEKLVENYKTFNNLSFSRPGTYKISTDDPKLMEYEKYLYLALQLPATHNSPIVVLEGDYTQHADRHISDVASIYMISDLQLSKIFKGELSLLDNDGTQKPFANVLLEYLFENTIDSRELIDDNVTTIENKVHYFPKYNGHWSNTLRYILYRNYMDLDKHNIDKKDVLGFVDSKMEAAVHKGLILNVK